MLAGLGEALDAVVVLTVDPEELIQRLLQRAQAEGRADDTEEVVRRRQEVYAEQTAPLIEVYADRGLLVGSTAWARSTRSRRGCSTRSGRPRRLRAGRAMCSATAASRSRRPSRSTRCAPPGSSSARPSSCCARAVAPGMTTAELDAHRRGHIRAAAATPSFLGYARAFPATICVSVNDEVVHGIPGDRVIARRRHRLHRLRRDRRRLARRRRDDGGGRRGPARGARADAGHRGGDVARGSPPPGSAAGSATSPTPWRVRPQPGRLRDRRGLHRARDRHRDAPAAQRPQLRPRRPRGRSWSRASRSPSSRWSSLGEPWTHVLDDEWTVAPTTGRWPRTSSTPSPSPPTAPGCSPPSTAARPGSPSSASPSAAPDPARSSRGRHRRTVPDATRAAAQPVARSGPLGSVAEALRARMRSPSRRLPERVVAPDDVLGRFLAAAPDESGWSWCRTATPGLYVGALPPSAASARRSCSWTPRLPSAGPATPTAPRSCPSTCRPGPTPTGCCRRGRSGGRATWRRLFPTRPPAAVEEGQPGCRWPTCEAVRSPGPPVGGAARGVPRLRGRLRTGAGGCGGGAGRSRRWRGSTCTAGRPGRWSRSRSPRWTGCSRC